MRPLDGPAVMAGQNHRRRSAALPSGTGDGGVIGNSPFPATSTDESYPQPAVDGLSATFRSDVPQGPTRVSLVVLVGEGRRAGPMVSPSSATSGDGPSKSGGDTRGGAEHGAG